VWVVGNQDWMDQAPEEVARICEEEVKDYPSDLSSYRIVIIGEHLGRVEQPYTPQWGSRLSSSLLIRNKLFYGSGGGKRFQSAAEPLLKCMAAYYDQMQRSPTPVLQALHVPHAFYGDA